MDSIVLKNNTVYSESEIINTIKSVKPSISDIKLKWMLFELEKSHTITRIGTKEYITDGKRYSYELSESTKIIDSFLEETYPDIKYVIWENTQLNEWMNFLFAKKIVFVEVETDLKGFVFSSLQEKFGHSNAVLLNPDIEIISRYIDNDPIVVRSLFSRSPRNKKCHSIPIEKLLIDILCDKLLINLIGTNNRYEIAYGIVRDYSINKTKATAYAKRRKCESELLNILEDNHN